MNLFGPFQMPMNPELVDAAEVNDHPDHPSAMAIAAERFITRPSCSFCGVSTQTMFLAIIEICGVEQDAHEACLLKLPPGTCTVLVWAKSEGLASIRETIQADQIGYPDAA